LLWTAKRSWACWSSVKDSHLLVENVAVAPAAQGHGVGSALLNHAETTAALLGLPEVHLYTNEVMTENLTFYRQRGYTLAGRGIQDGYRRVFFSKTLGAQP
jgi:GNAT superfamily N-acetyltransferase